MLGVLLICVLDAINSESVRCYKLKNIDAVNLRISAARLSC